MLTCDLKMPEVFMYFIGTAYLKYHAELSRFNGQLSSGHPLVSVGKALARNMDRTAALAWLPFSLTGPEQGPGRGMSSDSLDRYLAVENVRGGLETLLAAISINAWTTYESLATDLWIAAVNSRPSKLGHRIAKPTADGAGKSILFDEIAIHRFDVRDHVGDILATKYNFNKLDELKGAYSRAFGKDSSTARLLFDQKLRMASQVRHVLVHRGGIADQEFIDNTKGIPEMPPVARDAEIPLDGTMAAILVDGTTRLAIELLRAVHGWLSANPD